MAVCSPGPRCILPKSDATKPMGSRAFLGHITSGRIGGSRSHQAPELLAIIRAFRSGSLPPHLTSVYPVLDPPPDGNKRPIIPVPPNGGIE